MLLLLFYYSVPCEFITPALPGGLTLKFQWQQVSSCLQDSSQHSGRSKQCMDGLDSLSDFYFFQSTFQALETASSAPSTTGIIVNLMFYSFLSSLARFVNLFTFFHFTLWSAGTGKSIRQQVLFFKKNSTRSGHLAWIK